MPERFSASVAGRHMACHASANLPAAIPNWQAPEPVVGGAADEGTSKHEMLEQITNLRAKDMLHMAAALTYVAELRQRRRFNVLTEASFKAEWLVTAPKTTVDVVLYTQDELHIIDWKTGKIPVEVVDNHQLLYYAVCAAPLAPKAKGATLHIVQPWANNITSWFADTNTLNQFMTDAIAAEAAIQAGSTTFSPGDHCTFCAANPHGRGAKGRPFCPAMMQIHYPSPFNEDEILGL